MTDKILWITGPALFSIIGMTAGYLSDPDYTVLATLAGCVVGFVITSFALAGNNPQ